MKFLNKKIPLGFSLAAVFISGALVYSFGYKVAMDKFNDVVSYAQEKQKMYSSVSEIDYHIRTDYVGEISESNLMFGLGRGYAQGLCDSNCKFFSKDEYKKYKDNNKKTKSKIDATEIDGSVVYIKCVKISDNFAKKFIEQLDLATSKNINKLVIDLRNCSNGNIDEVFKILKRITPKGESISLVNSKGEKEVVCTSEVAESDLKIAVLINGETSGAEELIASALSGQQNGCVIGTKTAGNAVREKIVTLSDDSVLIFPDAHYVAQNGKVIFKQGVQPDIESILPDGIDLNSISNDEDLQLQDALSWLHS